MLVFFRNTVYKSPKQLCSHYVYLYIYASHHQSNYAHIMYNIYIRKPMYYVKQIMNKTLFAVKIHYSLQWYKILHDV